MPILALLTTMAHASDIADVRDRASDYCDRLEDSVEAHRVLRAIRATRKPQFWGSYADEADSAYSAALDAYNKVKVGVGRLPEAARRPGERIFDGLPEPVESRNGSPSCSY